MAVNEFTKSRKIVRDSERELQEETIRRPIKTQLGKHVNFKKRLWIYYGFVKQDCSKQLDHLDI